MTALVQRKAEIMGCPFALRLTEVGELDLSMAIVHMDWRY